MLSAEQVKVLLHLEPLPGEGGFYRETYRSAISVSPDQLPEQYQDARCLSTAIHYFLTPETSSALHLLPGDEVFHFYLGDPVEMLQLHPDGRSERIIIGNDLAAGHSPQVLVPGGTWQGSRLLPGGAYALLGTTMSPGFEFADYNGADRNQLLTAYPNDSDLIKALTLS